MEEAHHGGTNTTAIAVGVAVPVGAVAVAGVGILTYFMRRRKKFSKDTSSIETGDTEEDEESDVSRKSSRGHVRHNSLTAHHMF